MNLNEPHCHLLRTGVSGRAGFPEGGAHLRPKQKMAAIEDSFRLLTLNILSSAFNFST